MDTISVWAIGPCKHPVCYICSSRMRVLGRSEETKNECAICKQDMKNVVFHDSPFDFNSIKIGKVGLKLKRVTVDFKNPLKGATGVVLLVTFGNWPIFS